MIIDTPQSVMDASGRDVFEEIIPNTAYSYTKKRNELWSRYRYFGIGSCNIEYWIQCMKDRYALIEESWDAKIKAWDEYVASIASKVSFAAGSNSETVTDTRSFTTEHTGTISDSGSNTGTVTTEREDTPDNPAGSTKYLAERDTRTDNLTNGNTRTFLNTDTVTNEGTLKTDREYYEGLDSATAAEYIDKVPDPWDGFTSQFRRLFCMVM